MLVATVQNAVALVLCTLDISLSIAVGQSEELRLYMKTVKSTLRTQAVYDYCHHHHHRRHHRKSIITLHKKNRVQRSPYGDCKRGGHSGFESR